MDLTISINKPIGFGLLTCENIEQAKAINYKLVQNDEQLHRVKKSNLEKPRT